MADFDFGPLAEGNVGEQKFVYELYVENTDKPIRVHMHPACPENEAYNKSARIKALKHRQKSQRRKDLAAEIGRDLSREAFPETIIFRIEDCPVKGGKTETLSSREDLIHFCKDLPASYWDELIEAATSLNNFYENPMSDEDVLEVGQDLGEDTPAV